MTKIIVEKRTYPKDAGMRVTVRQEGCSVEYHDCTSVNIKNILNGIIEKYKTLCPFELNDSAKEILA